MPAPIPAAASPDPELGGSADAAAGLQLLAVCDQSFELGPLDIECAARDPQAGVEGREEEMAQDEGLDNETAPEDQGKKEEGGAATEENEEKEVDAGGDDDADTDDRPPMEDSAAEGGKSGSEDKNFADDFDAQMQKEGFDAVADKNDSASVPTVGHHSHNFITNSLGNGDNEHQEPTYSQQKCQLSGLMKSYLQTALQQSSSPTEASKNASKNLLADKALVKAIVKACIEEDVTVIVASGANGNSIGVIDSLVEEYRSKHPLLTRQMIASGIARFRKLKRGNASGGKPKSDASSDSDVSEVFEGGGKKDIDHDIKLGRCINIVEEEILKYEERIDAIKKLREKMAAEAPPSRKKRKSAGGAVDATASPTPKKRGRPKTTGPETDLINDIFQRYVMMRRETPRLPNGAFESMVEDAKKDHDLEDFDLPLKKIRKRVAWRVINIPGRPRTGGTRRAMLDAAYDRYVRAIASNGGTLPEGTLKSIVEAVKLEHGMAFIDPRTIESQVRARFAERNPDLRIVESEALSPSADEGPLEDPLEGPPPGVLEDESEDDSEASDTSSEESDVQPARSRVPAHAVDEPLVATINNWLSQGLSVTRSQGLEIANSLMTGLNSAKKGGEGKENEDVKLGVDWWKYFIKRNKEKLVYLLDKKPVSPESKADSILPSHV